MPAPPPTTPEAPPSDARAWESAEYHLARETVVVKVGELVRYVAVEESL